MKITRNKFVAIDYILHDENGEVIDSSDENEPLEYIHGNGFLINGLENELEDKEEGDEFTVTIAPKDAYGEHDASLVVEVDKSQFPDDTEIEEGMEFEAENGQIVRVKSVGDEKILIDANHPMAGKTLTFDIKVVTVRDATEKDVMAMLGSSCGGCNGGGCSGCGGGCNDNEPCENNGGGCCCSET